jgi:PIN domain nuclease of toxin-antitoxin system
MNLLIDTHILLWWLDDNPALPEYAMKAIADTGNVVIVSAAVIWEIRVKQSLGKLAIVPKFHEVVMEQGFELLPIAPEHAYAVGDLPRHHRDPFDRILIVQCQMGGYTMVTHDAMFGKYDIAVLG